MGGVGRDGRGGQGRGERERERERVETGWKVPVPIG